MKHQQIELGQCYVVPLADNRKAYGQYVYWDNDYGPLSRVFAFAGPKVSKVEDLPTRELLFPPIFIGFGSVFKAGRWQIIGSLPVVNFSFPKFRFTFGRRLGRHRDWKIYDGARLILIGDLPPEYRSLEFLCAWSPQLVEQRIATGKNRYDNLL